VGLERSTYYDIKHHRPSDREIRHLPLEDAITGIHQRSRATYGVRRIRAALEIEQGLIVNYKLVLKIMRRLGFQGVPGPKKGRRNLVNAATNEDLVKRQFSATRPNELWLTDITEHPTREAKVYCCCVLDLFSRKIVGWSINRHCDSDLVNGALSMAATSRSTSAQTVIHSDHGSQGSPRGPFRRTSPALDSLVPWAPLATATTTPPWSPFGVRCRLSYSTERSGPASWSSPKLWRITLRTSTMGGFKE